MFAKSKKSVILKINGQIDTACLEYIKGNISLLITIPPENLIVYVRSRGGDLGTASQIVDELDRLSEKGTKITMISYDFVSSSALAIFARGNYRFAVKEKDEFFFHNATGENVATVLEGQNNAFIFMAKQFGQTERLISNLSKTNTTVTAIEAKQLGIINLILNKTRKKVA